MSTLGGKVAVITGAGRGQGRSHALFLAREGVKVVVSDIDFQIEPIPYPMNAPEDLAETVALIEAEGGECLAVPADVRDRAQVDRLVHEAVRTYGGLDIMIANAGGWSPSVLPDMSDDAWRTVLDINLTGAFNCIRAAAPPMIDRGAGRIVVTSSAASRYGMPNMANYVASRWGQMGLVKSAAIDLGPHNITVNAVCPTTVETLQVTNDVMWKLFRPDLENPTRDDAEGILRGTHVLPTAWIQPEDVSAAVLFLVSDGAQYITGSGIDVSAGQAARYTA